MKKKYISPETKIVMIDSTQLLITSGWIDVDTGEEGDQTKAESRPYDPYWDWDVQEFGILNYELVALWAIKNDSMKNLKCGTEGH